MTAADIATVALALFAAIGALGVALVLFVVLASRGSAQ